MMHRWPVKITSEEIYLQPLRFRDRGRWNALKAENRQWLEPWEATVPSIEPNGEDLNRHELPSYMQMVRNINSEARNGRSFSFAIWHERNLIGQISLGGVIYGAMRGGHIGYWVDQNYINKGYMTRAVALVTDFAFTSLMLHRLEINLRPENAASRRVAEKAGFSFEGERPRYLHIDGQWRDHSCFVKENSSIN